MRKVYEADETSQIGRRIDPLTKLGRASKSITGQHRPSYLPNTRSFVSRRWAYGEEADEQEPKK